MVFCVKVAFSNRLFMAGKVTFCSLVMRRVLEGYLLKRSALVCSLLPSPKRVKTEYRGCNLLFATKEGIRARI